MNFRNKKLMYKAWVPFDYSSAILFYITYTHQMIGMIASYEMVEKIFEIKWMTLNENSKKSLMIIMKRALVPIQIKCAYTIPMNLNSFMNILKMSYSTYNLLQHMDK
ncbi:uncharacterized protein LOC105198466 [Solenopsis invicta]|uniref:uncharacterized protein LOC105198466 n=1 Tax=Solenopsis invicta TaxID=13686 RepID=UPI00193CF81C|nr:uncharacterized protein LOC105198466 [Solenopsis invicta]